jgi:hypothetical protein
MVEGWASTRYGKPSEPKGSFAELTFRGGNK